MQTEAIIYMLQTSGDQVLCAEFSAQEKMQMVTCGKSHIAFWNMENGVLVKKLGLFEVCICSA